MERLAGQRESRENSYGTYVSCNHWYLFHTKPLFLLPWVISVSSLLTSISCGSLCVELHGPPRKSPCSLYSPLPVSQSSFCLDWRDFVFVGIPLTQSHSYSDQCQSSCHRHTLLTFCLCVWQAICPTSPQNI